VTQLLEAPVSDSAALPDTPYVGLVPYSEEDAAFFFGREAEKTIVTANVRANRLTLLYGPSGVGKTSLLQAGVVHDLRERVAQNSAAGAERPPFAVAVCRGWRDAPLPLLMEEIRSSVSEALGGQEVGEWHSGNSVLDALRGWTERVRTLLVVLDQFEDYFLYHPTEPGEETFDAQFPAIVNDPNLRVNFLVSIREDAWAKLDRFEGRIPQLFANYVRIEHLTRAGARDAVERPVVEYNRRLALEEAPYVIEPDLRDAVVLAASAGEPALEEGTNGNAPVSDEVETPFLQLVMERLWRATVEAGERELTLATLERLGGAQEIVERHLVDALATLNPREQEIAADSFRYLVTSSRRKVVQSASDLSEWLTIPESELVPVLEKLASGDSGRILRPVPPPPGHEDEGARYEIFHDVLGEPILEWRKEFERERQAQAEAHRQRAVRRRLIAILVGLIVLVLCFAAFAAWALHERHVARDQAHTAESQALAARALRVQALDPKQTLVLASQAEDVKSTPQADEALRRALVGSPKPIQLWPRKRTVYSVDFDPNGRYIAVAGGGGSRVLTVTGGPVANLDPQKRVISARFSPDGKYVATAGANGAVRVWRAGDWHALGAVRIIAHHLARAAFAADGRYLVAGGYPGWPNRVWRFEDGRIGPRLTKRDGVGGWIEPDGTARVVDAMTAASAARLARDTSYAFATGPRGGSFVAAGRDIEITPVYRTRKRTVLAELPYSDGAALSPDGKRVVIQGSSGSEIWDLVEKEPQVILLHGYSYSSYGASFSPDGRLVASASGDDDTATTRVWDSQTGAVLAELPPQPPRFDRGVTIPDPYPVPGSAPSGQVGGGVSGSRGGGLPPAFALQPTAGFSPDSGLVTTWGRDGGGAQLWQPFGVRQLERLRRGSSASGLGLPLPTAVSPDGRLVAAAERDNSIGVWRTRDGQPVAPLRGSTKFVSGIAFTRHGDLLAASSHDGSVRVWRVNDGHLLLTLDAGDKRVGAVAINPEGTLLASGNEDGTVHVWRVPSGERETVLRLPSGSVAAVAFSGDGGRLVAGGRGGVTQVWRTGDWNDPVVLRRTRTRALIVQALLNEDGERVATLDQKGVARLWSSDDGQPLRTFWEVDTIAFSPDGTQLLAGGGKATGLIVPTSDGKDLRLLRGHEDVVNDARFAPEGDLVVTAGASDDPTVRLWQAETNGPIAVFSPSVSPVLRAMLAADGRLVTVSEDGVRLYACEPCLRTERLRAIAKARLAAR